jgi:hypothetical protein
MQAIGRGEGTGRLDHGPGRLWPWPRRPRCGERRGSGRPGFERSGICRVLFFDMAEVSNRASDAGWSRVDRAFRGCFRAYGAHFQPRKRGRRLARFFRGSLSANGADFEPRNEADRKLSRSFRGWKSTYGVGFQPRRSLTTRPRRTSQVPGVSWRPQPCRGRNETPGTQLGQAAMPRPFRRRGA